MKISGCNSRGSRQKSRGSGDDEKDGNGDSKRDSNEDKQKGQNLKIKMMVVAQ